MIPDPETQPLMTVPAAGAELGLSKSASYRAAERGELPTIRLGRRLMVVTAELRRKVGLEQRPGSTVTQLRRSPPAA